MVKPSWKMVEKKKRILAKVGTNVLTRNNGRLDYNRIMDLVDQIAVLKRDYEVVLVSSGAAGAGREIIQLEDEKDPIIRRQMLASIGQGRLFQVYADFFKEHGIIPAQALLTRRDFSSQIPYANMRSSLEGLLKRGIIPIINENDVVSYRECSFGDNDQLAALVAALLQVDLMVILSDIPGFYTADPKKDSSATLIRKVEKISPELMALCEDSVSSGGTGGMYSKLKAAELATQYGIPAVVTSGKEDGSLLDAVFEQKKGTYFDAQPTNRKPFSIRGSWMTSGAHIGGTITVDEGAEMALRSNKSLLVVGVLALEGEFKKRDVLLIQNREHIRIGAGLSSFDSQEIQGMLASHDRPTNKVVIHKNHLYTL